MKKFTGILTMMLLLLTSVAVAQPGGGRGERGERMTPEERAAKETSRMVGELELTEEQAAQVEQINLNLAAKTTELREASRESGASREEMRENMKAQMETIREEHKAELQAVLTEGQFEKYKAMIAEQAERRGNRGERGDRPRRGGEENSDE